MAALYQGPSGKKLRAGGNSRQEQSSKWATPSTRKISSSIKASNTTSSASMRLRALRKLNIALCSLEIEPSLETFPCKSEAGQIREILGMSGFSDGLSEAMQQTTFEFLFSPTQSNLISVKVSR